MHLRSIKVNLKEVKDKLSEAKLFEQIEIVFRKKSNDRNRIMLAGDILAHFARTSRLKLIDVQKKDNLMIVAKTPNFNQDYDPGELAGILAPVMEKINIRKVPPYSMVLEITDGGCYLKISGGNKELRKSFEDELMKRCHAEGILPTFLGDRSATCTFMVETINGDILEFAESLAEYYHTELSMN